MKRAFLFLVLSSSLFAGEMALKIDTNTHRIVVPPASPGATVDLDFTGLIIGGITGLGGGDALTTNPLSQFAATSSVQLNGVMSDNTGTGLVVFNESPLFVTPNLGTPTAATLTNAVGLPLASGITGFGSGWLSFLALTKPTTIAGYGITDGGDVLAASPFGTDNRLIRSDGTGKGVQGSGITIDDSNNASGVGTINSKAMPSKGGHFIVGDDTSLGATTELQHNVHYFGTLSADRTFTFAAGIPPSGGNSIILRLNVTAAGVDIIFPSSNRVGAAENPVTTLALPQGFNEFSWTFSNGAWWLVDTVSDVTGLVPTSRMVNGQALTGDVNVSDSSLVFGDNTDNNVSTTQHGFVPKITGSDGDVLKKSGTGAVWGAGAGGGNVSNTGTPTANQLAQWTSATVIQGITPTSPLTVGAGSLTLNVGTNFLFTSEQTLDKNDAGNNSVTDLLTLGHSTSGSAATGIGTGILYKAETDSGFSNLGRLSFEWADVVHASRDATAQISLVFNANTANTVTKWFPGTLGSMSVGGAAQPADGKINAKSGYEIDGVPVNVVGYTVNGGSVSNLVAADSTTYHFGWGESINITQHQTYANASILIPKTGTIKSLTWKVFFTTSGSNENVTHAIRLNDTSDTTLSTTETYDPAANTSKTFTYTGLSLAVTTGNTISLKVVTPAWVTNPAFGSSHLQIYIE